MSKLTKGRVSLDSASDEHDSPTQRARSASITTLSRSRRPSQPSSPAWAEYSESDSEEQQPSHHAVDHNYPCQRPHTSRGLRSEKSPSRSPPRRTTKNPSRQRADAVSPSNRHAHSSNSHGRKRSSSRSPQSCRVKQMPRQHGDTSARSSQNAHTSYPRTRNASPPHSRHTRASKCLPKQNTAASTRVSLRAHPSHPGRDVRSSSRSPPRRASQNQRQRHCDTTNPVKDTPRTTWQQPRSGRFCLKARAPSAVLCPPSEASLRERVAQLQCQLRSLEQGPIGAAKKLPMNQSDKCRSSATIGKASGRRSKRGGRAVREREQRAFAENSAHCATSPTPRAITCATAATNGSVPTTQQQRHVQSTHPTAHSKARARPIGAPREPIFERPSRGRSLG